MSRIEGAIGPSTTQQHQTILIVDDEDALRDVMREVLEGDGYSVVEARSGVEAIEKLAHHAVDLVISDHGLPGGLQGRQMIDAAAQTHPGMKVLYISGYGEDAVNNGGRPFLPKPFTASALVATTKALLSPMRDLDTRPGPPRLVS